MSDTGIGGHNQKPRRSTTGVGTGNVDLSNYYTQDQLDALLSTKQNVIIPAKTFYVNGNNSSTGDGSIINPFMTIDRVLDKIRATGDFVGEQVITDRISIVVQPYSGINYQVSQNMWGNIDWVFEEGSKITDSPNFNGTALFDEETESNDANIIQIFGLGEFVSQVGFFKSKSNYYVHPSVLTTNKNISWGKIDTYGIAFNVGHNNYSGSFGGDRPTTYFFNGNASTLSEVKSRTVNIPLIKFRNTSSKWAEPRFRNIIFNDAGGGNISSSAMFDLPYCSFATSFKNIQILSTVNNKSILFKVYNTLHNFLIDGISVNLGSIKNGVSLFDFNVPSLSSNALIFLNDVLFFCKNTHGNNNGQPHLFIKNSGGSTLNNLSITNVVSKHDTSGLITYKSDRTYYNQIGGQYRFDNLPGSGNNLEIDANGNVVRGTGGGGETVNFIFAHPGYTANNALMSPTGDMNGRVTAIPIPFDIEITDISVSANQTTGGATMGCEIRTLPTSTAGLSTAHSNTSGSIITSPSFIVGGTGTRYDARQNFNLTTAITVTHSNMLLVVFKTSDFNTYGGIVVIKANKL